MLHSASMDSSDCCSAFPPPRKPEESECCGQGCRSCVLDLYEQELKIWNKKRVSVNANPEDCEFMSPDNYIECCLEEIEAVCDSVSLYHFSLPNKTRLTFTAGQHLIVREENLARPYTLISPPGTTDHFSILIKLYEDGPMSRIIRTKWHPGCKVSWRGPLGAPSYRSNLSRYVILIGAGTGIAPLYQLARTITDNEDDETRVKLLYSCRAYREILLRPELHRMQGYWNFSVRYFLSRDKQKEAESLRKHNEDITYSRLTKEILHQECCSLSSCVRVYLCGPKSFESYVIDSLESVVDKYAIETF